MSWERSPLARHLKSIINTYGWKCKCGEEMIMNSVKVQSIPTCLMCDRLMYMMYSINPKGEVWMNKSLLLDGEFE